LPPFVNEENRPAVANLSSAFENGRIVDGREHVYDLQAWDELWSLSRKPGIAKEYTTATRGVRNLDLPAERWRQVQDGLVGSPLKRSADSLPSRRIGCT
jgi:hypothetical protein